MSNPCAGQSVLLAGLVDPDNGLAANDLGVSLDWL